MVLLKDLKSVLYINETVNIHKENCRLECAFYGKAKDIPQELDNYIVYDIFINVCEELSIYIKE